MKIKTLIAAGGLGKRLQGFRGNESTKVLLEVKKNTNDKSSNSKAD